jgi:hypothetical protein
LGVVSIAGCQTSGGFVAPAIGPIDGFPAGVDDGHMETISNCETTVAVVWPTIGATFPGRIVGRLAGLQLPGDVLHVVGRLFAAASIPLSLCVFFWQVMPFVARRYRVTDRRIVVQKGLQAVDERSLGLAEFDAVEVDVLPGQKWLRAGDLVFRKAGEEVFRLAGVPSPEAFLVLCRDVQRALAC